MLEILSDLKISNCETRHCSVVSVGCPLYSDTQLIDSWQLWRGRAGDALDSVRQDRHYARKVALVTSVMVVILPPIWKLLSLISFINLLFSLVISLKVRRERTQYPQILHRNCHSCCLIYSYLNRAVGWTSCSPVSHLFRYFLMNNDYDKEKQ